MVAGVNFSSGIGLPTCSLRTKKTITNDRIRNYSKFSLFPKLNLPAFRSSSTMATNIVAPAAFGLETAEKLVQSLRKTFGSGLTKSIEWREQQLSAIERMIDENEDAIVQAIADDFGKPKIETLASEVLNFCLTCVRVFLVSSLLWFHDEVLMLIGYQCDENGTVCQEEFEAMDKKYQGGSLENPIELFVYLLDSLVLGNANEISGFNRLDPSTFDKLHPARTARSCPNY